MVCRLCLADDNENILIFGDEKIQVCIARFLKLELKPEDPISTTICGSCWQILDDFQYFCMKIEQAQQHIAATQEQVQVEEEHKQSDSGSVRPDSPSYFKIKNEFTSDSDDDSFDFNDETAFIWLDEETFRVNIDNVLMSETLNSQEENTLAKVTDNSVLNNVENGSPPEIVVKKRKQGRPRKDQVDDMKNTEVKKIYKGQEISNGEKKRRRSFDIVSEKRKPGRPRKESLDKNVQPKNVEKDTTLSPSKKRSRGRPRKGEKHSKILRTCKEYDTIIQNNITLTCDICSTTLTDFAELKRHFRTIHQRRGYAVCCNQRFFARGLVVDHLNTHQEK